MSKTYVIKENNFKAVKDAVTSGRLQQAAKAGAKVIQTYARLNASTGRPGLNVGAGTLRESIITDECQSTKTHAEENIGPTVVYGRIHELGGTITPNKAKALHFVIDGQHITSKAVVIPARPYLRPAVDEHENEIVSAISTILESEIERVT